jgi:hypothetical protein
MKWAYTGRSLGLNSIQPYYRDEALIPEFSTKTHPNRGTLPSSRQRVPQYELPRHNMSKSAPIEDTLKWQYFEQSLESHPQWLVDWKPKIKQFWLHQYKDRVSTPSATTISESSSNASSQSSDRADDNTRGIRERLCASFAGQEGGETVDGRIPTIYHLSYHRRAPSWWKSYYVVVRAKPTTPLPQP